MFDGIVVGYLFLPGYIINALDLLIIDNCAFDRHLIVVLSRLIVNVFPLVRDVLQASLPAIRNLRSNAGGYSSHYRHCGCNRDTGCDWNSCFM